MTFELAADFLRIINYFLIFYVLDEDLFSTTTNSHIIISKYGLIVLWFLFTTRKLIIWVNLLIVQKSSKGEVDLSPWESSRIISNKVE